MRANLGTDSVLERRDDLAAGSVILRVRGEDQRYVQGQAHGVALNLNVTFLHDVEEAHLNLPRKVGEFVDGEDAAIGAGQQAVVHGDLIFFFPFGGGIHGYSLRESKKGLWHRSLD